MAAVGVVDPGTQAYPAVQLAVQEATVRPLDDPYRPASQGPLQSVVGMADTAPYRPALQFVHSPAPERLYFPAGHMAAVALVDPAMHANPAVQFPLQVDTESPLMAPYDPASHGPLHAALGKPTTAPYRPAMQLVQTPAPLRLYFPGSQMLAVALKVPAGQA